MSFREFDLGLRRFAEETVPAKVGDFRDAVALEALRGLVMLTPVDTGRARGNWQVTVGEPATGYDDDRRDESGGSTIADGASAIGRATDPFASIWLHDGVPYITYINDGTERTGAVHMLERTVERLARRFGR